MLLQNSAGDDFFFTSFLITFHVKPQAVARTGTALTLLHLKDKEAPQRDFSSSMTLHEREGSIRDRLITDTTHFRTYTHSDINT